METNGRGEIAHVAQHGNGGVIDTYNFLDGIGQPYVIFKTGPGAPDYARSMVWDSLGRIVENSEPNTVDRVTGRTIRYAYDDANRLAGTSDARGCGVDFYYDSLGRTVGENYSPCVATQQDYTAYVPGATPNGLEVEYRYDAYDPAQVNAEPGFNDDPGLAAGRLAARIDRGAETHLNYDARGRTRRVSRRIAKPLSQQAPGTDPLATHWYRQRIDFDLAGRVSARSTGVEEGEFLARGAGSESYTYSSRGLLLSVTSGMRSVIDSVTYKPEGMVDQVTYGDLAHTTATRTYDPARLRLDTYTVSRAAQTLWANASPGYTQPGAETTQTILADFAYHYDLVGNPDEINDFTPITGFNEDTFPVRQRRISNDDFYRVTRVEHGYGTPTGSAFFRSPFRPETVAGDTRPVSRASLGTRIASQDFAFDFMGNTLSTADDLSASYDRSLGAVTNGDGTGWGPNQLTAATGVNARYDEAGNLVELKVERGGGDCPSGAGSHCAQWYAYEWDEVGQLSRARRWDYPTTLPAPAGDVPDEDPAWDLRYAYSGGARVLKTSKDALAVERHTLEVFDTLRFERDDYIPAAEDYERHRATTHVYLAGGTGHVFYDDALPLPDLGEVAPNVRMYINVGDHLGSTSAVIDHTTSELVERSTFMAYGAIESDHRPARWSHAREPYKFTGKEEDIEVGATYFGARYYNAHLGRFMSPDPLTIHGFASDMNPYAYVRGRVMSHVDPLGLEDQQVQAAVDASAGTAGQGPPPPVLGTRYNGDTRVTTTCEACWEAQFARPYATGPVTAPDSSGLMTLDRGGGGGYSPSGAARGNWFGLDEVGDTKWMDDRGANLAKHPEAIKPEAAAWTGVILAAVVINFALAELSPAPVAAAPAAGGGLVRFGIASLLSAIGTKAQGCSAGCNSPSGRAALQGAMDRVRAACPGAACAELSDKLGAEVRASMSVEGQLLTAFPSPGTGMTLPTLPGVAPAGGWLGHVVLQLPDGTVADALRNIIYSSQAAYLAATYSAPVTLVASPLLKP